MSPTSLIITEKGFVRSKLFFFDRKSNANNPLEAVDFKIKKRSEKFHITKSRLQVE